MNSTSKAHNQTLRIAAYCRTAGVVPGEDSLAIAAQLAAVADWCRDNLAGHHFEIESFIDAGFSGNLGWEPSGEVQGHRPALHDLVEAVIVGALDVVVVYRFDRLARSARVLADFLAVCESADGVRLVGVADGLDSANNPAWPALMAHALRAIGAARRHQCGV